MKNKLKAIIFWLCIIAIIVFCILTDKVLFETVMHSNMPDWLKWIILRR